jgi:hypothetical protein
MASPAEKARAHLEQVARLREARQDDAGLASRVAAIKRYQHARFSRDYASLLDSERYGEATRFFLDDLYSPSDFADRDRQFDRVVPAMARVFPADVMHTVADLAELHALTESLDQEMALQVKANAAVDDESYRAAWRAVGRGAARQRQLDLLMAIGMSLDQHTQNAFLATTLRMMRVPAKAAGLARLQSFLERGLAAFVKMRGARHFLETVRANEQRTIVDLFALP